MRVVFLGTSRFAVPSLEAIQMSGRHQVALVVSQPDRPAGRGRKPEPPVVKTAAAALAVDVLQPEKINTEAARAAMRAARPDVLVVVSFGQILRPKVLTLAAHGCLNVHGSLLPRHRGASPVQAQILAGDDPVGVSVMRLDEGLDTGPVGARGALPALPEETAGELHDRLATRGAALLVEVLDRLATGSALFEPQNDALATTCSTLAKAAGHVEFGIDAETVVRRIRAFHPWPGSHADLCGEFGQRRIQIDRAALSQWRGAAAPPGTLVDVTRDRLTFVVGQGAVDILSLKVAGKRTMSVADFLNGTHVKPGDRLQSIIDPIGT